VWEVEYRGTSRDTKFPPGFEAGGPYTHAGRQFRFKSEFVSTLVVDAQGTLTKIKVTDIDLYSGTFTQPQSIAGTLTTPSGVAIPLFSWNCSSGAPTSMHVTLDDTSSSPIPYSCTQNFAGIFKSDFGQLATLRGAQIEGTWVLRTELYSNETGVTNYFNRWGVEICYR
jgi:hypothetical protein